MTTAFQFGSLGRLYFPNNGSLGPRRSRYSPQVVPGRVIGEELRRAHPLPRVTTTPAYAYKVPEPVAGVSGLGGVIWDWAKSLVTPASDPKVDANGVPTYDDADLAADKATWASTQTPDFIAADAAAKKAQAAIDAAAAGPAALSGWDFASTIKTVAVAAAIIGGVVVVGPIVWEVVATRKASRKLLR